MLGVPTAENVGPFALMTPPPMAYSPNAPSPLVDRTFPPFSITCEPVPLANTACESMPVVVTGTPVHRRDSAGIGLHARS